MKYGYEKYKNCTLGHEKYKLSQLIKQKLEGKQEKEGKGRLASRTYRIARD